MNGKDVDFKTLVARTRTGRASYLARIQSNGTESFKEIRSLLVKSIDEDKRQIEAVVSTADIDRHGEIILPEAFKESLPGYLRNPVIISTHQHRLDNGHSSVVGQVVKAWIDAKGLHVIIWFAETELGEEYWYLYKNKFQRAFSVGFMEQESRDEFIGGRRVLIHTKIELLEISCVPVPANQNALSKSKQRKADFVAEKKALHKADEFAKMLLSDDLGSFGIPDAQEDGFDLSDKTELEPDYAKTVGTNRLLNTSISKGISAAGVKAILASEETPLQLFL